MRSKNRFVELEEADFYPDFRTPGRKMEQLAAI
jgi:hypothetical protein